MTFKILTEDTLKIIDHSCVHTATDPPSTNFHADGVRTDVNIINNPTLLKLKCSLNNDQFEEVITYNDLMAYIAKDQDNKVLWQFKNITAHEGPLTPNHPNWKGSRYNVMIEWENGELSSSKPLNIIAADGPVECTIYVKENTFSIPRVGSTSN